MSKVILILTLLGLALAQQAWSATPNRKPAPDTQTLNHGGGCRKSSPPGECCHMEKKTGQVHCHK
ncbi:hypothetical protein HJ526_03560 [Donghicola sp. C2-DW-16]|uniref:Uncharacterized protein n=1 Tax=Donghicola mangrovi TaxID=2729614 RepID=A0A850PYN3_9RHOB|nr:hypothetical protein [Donghicola mangrovi]NVO21923.1 hypothetical protein [Donghicola mangrovi]NVO26487.1 hypothetical protein [Donghicola mangrovi]